MDYYNNSVTKCPDIPITNDDPDSEHCISSDSDENDEELYLVKYLTIISYLNIIYDTITLTIYYLQSEICFSDTDENLDDLADEIVLNEDIYNELICNSGNAMASSQLFWIKIL